MIESESEVAGVATDDGAPKRGRRLSSERSDVILGTVLDLLEEVGYDQIRMQDVADRAGVGLSTIYRRWPAKQDVVRAALTSSGKSTLTSREPPTGAALPYRKPLRHASHGGCRDGQRSIVARQEGPLPASGTCRGHRLPPAHRPGLLARPGQPGARPA